MSSTGDFGLPMRPEGGDEVDPRQVGPRHIGFIMDGNGRWAQQRQLPRTHGHSEGAQSLRRMIRLAKERGISEVTCFALSTENLLHRPDPEVQFLLELLVQHLQQEREEMDRHQVCFRSIGRRDGLPPEVVQALDVARRETAHHEGIVFRLAVNYGGRAEIADALSSAASADVDLSLSQRERQVSEHLYEPGMTDLDLLIRTGGEMRLSNFLLWQSSYAELYFTDVLWPDFDAQHLDLALEEYSRRSRRFGSVPSRSHGGEA
ncbi:MAG: polyprenyl diphosphate synthase [Planctomycetota bacterium]|nr:polyprenyl diphosphate synthase [Planctomycetota bacterium]